MSDLSGSRYKHAIGCFTCLSISRPSSSLNINELLGITNWCSLQRERLLSFPSGSGASQSQAGQGFLNMGLGQPGGLQLPQLYQQLSQQVLGGQMLSSSQQAQQLLKALAAQQMNAQQVIWLFQHAQSTTRYESDPHSKHQNNKAAYIQKRLN